MQTGRVLLHRAEASVNKISISKNKSSQISYCKSHKDEFAELEMRPAGRCWRCGGKHCHRLCRFKDSKCHKCSAVGYIASKCNTRFKKALHVDDGDASDSESDGELYGSYTVTDKSKEIKDTLIIDGCPLTMEIGTGVSVPVVSESFSSSI